MKLLVVTPTLGESPWLAETTASVPVGCVHLLVTPASTVDALRRRFPGTTVIAEPGGGMYAAINAGLAAATADWDAFTYINDDDVLLAAFSRVVEAARGGGARIAYGGVRLIDARGARLGGIPISRVTAQNRALYAQRIEPVYQHGTVITRAVVEQLGAFDASLRFCGDSEFLARACVKGIPFVHARAGEVAAFRLRKSQLTKNRAAMIAERALVDERLGLLTPQRTLRHVWARLLFRAANTPIYLERIARYGFVSFDTVLARAA